VWVRIVMVCGMMLLAPWVDAALLADRAGTAGDSGFQVAGVLPKNSAEQFELTFWSSIKDSKQVSDYEAYLQAYPKGRFAGLARARVEQLRAAKPPGQAPPQGQAGSQQAASAPGPKPGHEPQAHPAAKQPAARAHGAGATANGPVAALKDCGACPVMLALYPDSFTMGSRHSDPAERPAHKVAIHTPYALGKYEVTVEQWNACVQGGACPSVASAAGAAGNLPMRDVSWDDAQLYLNWLGTVSGKAYRLPSEAEWEYAARGGTTTRYWWGDQVRGGNASCKECGQPWDADKPPPVGSFVANPYGFFDMNGSVWEWVNDCWHSSYRGAPADGSAWASPSCPTRVIRGGSWRDDVSYMSSSTRFKDDASVRASQNGFRVARDLQ
jgi:formylglycine-generating enzyme required for sulfatase activity